MNCSPTLTESEFKDLHNGLWNIRSAMHQLEEVINPTLYKQLAAGMSLVEKGLKGAYQQDHEAYSVKSNYYTEFAEQQGLRSVWSVFSVEDFQEEHPYKGADLLVYEDHWGENPVQVAIEGPLWGDLFRAADVVIKASGDSHHVFIEGFKAVSPKVLHLTTGS